MNDGITNGLIVLSIFAAILGALALYDHRDV